MSSSFESNSPKARTMIRAEVRKSFSFGIWIKDESGRALDISNSYIGMTVKKLPLANTANDSDNLIENDSAILEFPEEGYARFDLQASDLNLEPGSYPYTITLREDGYSSVLAKGELQLVANTEVDSISSQYAGDAPVTAMQVMMRGRVVVEVKAGAMQLPGTTAFTVGDQRKLAGIEAGAQQNVQADWMATSGDTLIINKPTLGTAAFENAEDIALPPGGAPGEILMKLSSGDFDTQWTQPPEQMTGAPHEVDPTGVLEGYVPTANGSDGWSWRETGRVYSVNGEAGNVQLDMDEIPDSATRVAMTSDERQMLNDIQYPVPWADVDDKPNFGTAAYQDDSAFLSPGEVDAASDITAGTLNNERVPKVSALRGFTSGLAAPTGGADGDLYFQYI